VLARSLARSAHERRARRVVGGGLAGIAAALELADDGASVTLFEARTRLGGATYSVQRNGLLDRQRPARAAPLLHRVLAASSPPRRRAPRADPAALRVPILREGKPPAFLHRAPLPAPLHLVPTLLRYALLDRASALGASRAAARCASSIPRRRRSTSGRSATGSRARAVRRGDRRALEPDHAADAQPARGRGVARARDVRLPHRLLDAATPATSASRRAAAAAPRRRATARSRRRRRIVLGAPARAVGRRASCSTARRETSMPRSSRCRTTPWPIVPPARRRRRARALGASPIVNLHVHYDRRVLDEPFAARRGIAAAVALRPHGVVRRRDGQLVSVSLSSAAPRSRADRDAARALPPRARAPPAERRARRVLDFTATREPRATFRAAPGSAPLRPGTRTSVPGLYLAGAWTATGWPATMESAVRSGRAAAAALLEDLAHGRRDRRAAA
jgi:hypothetical protein